LPLGERHHKLPRSAGFLTRISEDRALIGITSQTESVFPGKSSTRLTVLTSPYWSERDVGSAEWRVLGVLFLGIDVEEIPQ
jgi:hypothetical protein